MYDFDTLLKTDPAQFTLWLKGQFVSDIPLTFDTTEDLQKIGKLMGVTANRYSYIVAFLSYAKTVTRKLKRSGKEYKDAYEDMVDRRDALQNTADILKLQYQSMSRLITIRQEINAELRMSEL